MPVMNIDGQEYDLDQLPDEAKAQIASIQAVDMKLNELKRDSAIVMTARNMYVQALKKSLEQVKEIQSDLNTKPLSKSKKA